MAYIVPDSVEAIESTAQNSLDIEPPTGYQDNDLWIVDICQDGGGTTITAPAGWVQIATQAAVQNQRTTSFYKIVSGAQTTATFTGSNEEWVVASKLVRNADTSAPINVSARRDSADSTSSSLTVTGVTTTENNTLVCFAVGFDNSPKLINATVQTSVTLAKGITAGNCMITGYFNQATAGTTQNIVALSEVSTEGGNGVIYAIKDVDSANAQMSPMPLQGYEVIKRYGGITSAATNVAAFIRHDSVTWQNSSGNIIPTTIGSLSVGNPTTWSEVASTNTASPWGTFTSLRYQEAGGTPGVWFGYGHTMSSTNLANKIISLEFITSNVNNTLMGTEGWLIYFDDGTNWAAFQLSKRLRVLQENVYTAFIDVSNATPYGSGGTINWGAITKVHYLVHRTGSSTGTLDFRIKNLLAHNPTVLVDGCPGSPVNSDFLRIFLGNDQATLRGHGPYLLTRSANDVQSTPYTGLQIGNGSRKTYAELSPVSHKMPPAFDESSIVSRFWRVADDAPAAEYRIKLSANDTLSASYGATYITPTEQEYIIDSTSSTSATYDFSGQSVVGAKVTVSANIPINGAVFQDCEIIATTGSYNGVRFIENKNSISTADPSDFEDCEFTSPGTGHALTLTTPGTYNFNGNSFTGYGANGSTDAAIYNNSGGAVELIILEGDDTPTVRNGAGASTTITQPTQNQKVTLTNLVIGSRVQIYDLTADTELLNIIADATTEIWEDTNPYVADREIRIRIAYVNGTDARQFIENNIGTLTLTDPQVSFRVNQVDDDVYIANAIDGSTVTYITIDDGNMLLELSTSTETWQRMYAYEMYWLFTSTGIQDLGQSITAPDTANYLMDSSVLVIKNVSGAPTVITGGWGRDKTTGSTLDIIDITGDPIFTNPEHVVAFAVGSGVTSQDKTDIIDGVVNELEPLTEEVLSNTDATQAKINQL